MAKSFDRKTMTYSSPRPPIHPNLSLTSFLFQNTSSAANTFALADAHSDNSLTFRQLKTHVSALSHSLLHLGIRRGDVVLLLAPNSICFPVCFLAVVAIGAIATTCSPLYTVFELSTQVRDSKPKLVVTVLELFHKIEALTLDLPSIILDDPSSRINSSSTFRSKVQYYNDLIVESDESTDEVLANGVVSQSDVAALLYSSGTTGKSKGVMLTQRNFMATEVAGMADLDRYEEDREVDGDSEEHRWNQHGLV